MTRSRTDSPVGDTLTFTRTHRSTAHAFPPSPRPRPRPTAAIPAATTGEPDRGGGDEVTATGLRKSRHPHPRKALPALPRRRSPIGRASRDFLAPSREVATPSAKSAYSEVTSSESTNGPNAPRDRPSPARPAHSRRRRPAPRLRPVKSPEQGVCSGDGDLRTLLRTPPGNPSARRPSLPVQGGSAGELPVRSTPFTHGVPPNTQSDEASAITPITVDSGRIDAGPVSK